MIDSSIGSLRDMNEQPVAAGQKAPGRGCASSWCRGTARLRKYRAWKFAQHQLLRVFFFGLMGDYVCRILRSGSWVCLSVSPLAWMGGLLQVAAELLLRRALPALDRVGGAVVR